MDKMNDVECGILTYIRDQYYSHNTQSRDQLFRKKVCIDHMKISASIQYFMYHAYKKIDRFLISQNMFIDETTRTYIQLIPDQNFSFSEKKKLIHDTFC